MEAFENLGEDDRHRRKAFIKQIRTKFRINLTEAGTTGFGCTVGRNGNHEWYCMNEKKEMLFVDESFRTHK